MAERENRGLRNRTDVILIVAVALAALLLLWQVRGVIAGFRENEDSIFRDVRAQYEIEDHQYGTLITEYYRAAIDVAGEQSYDLDTLSVARYADAAFRLKVYKAAGEEEAAKEMRAHMQEAKTHMGIYSTQTETIKNLLGLVE